MQICIWKRFYGKNHNVNFIFMLNAWLSLRESIAKGFTFYCKGIDLLVRRGCVFRKLMWVCIPLLLQEDNFAHNIFLCYSKPKILKFNILYSILPWKFANAKFFQQQIQIVLSKIHFNYAESNSVLNAFWWRFVYKQDFNVRAIALTLWL